MSMSIDDVAGTIYKHFDVNVNLADSDGIDRSAERKQVYDNIRMFASSIVNMLKEGLPSEGTEYPDTGGYSADGASGMEIDGSAGVLSVTSLGDNVK